MHGSCQLVVEQISPDTTHQAEEGVLVAAERVWARSAHSAALILFHQLTGSELVSVIRLIDLMDLNL